MCCNVFLLDLIYNNTQGVTSANDLLKIMNFGNHFYSSLSRLATPKSDQHLISPYKSPRITHLDHENKGIDHLLKKLLIVKQTPLVSTLGNV